MWFELDGLESVKSLYFLAADRMLLHCVACLDILALFHHFGNLLLSYCDAQVL